MPVIDTPKEFLTDEVFMSGFRGIFVGGCIKRKEGSSFRARAHAHYVRYRGKPQIYGGWICVRSHRRLYKKDGGASRLLWHEMAHIVTGHGHDDTWRKKMREWKQPLPWRYKKKERRSNKK